MIPTPAKRRHHQLDQLHQPAAREEEEEDEDDDGEEEEDTNEEREAARSLSGKLRTSSASSSFSDQANKQQQHQQQQMSNHDRQAEVVIPLTGDLDEQEELFDEDDELDYLRLDTIVEEDETISCSDDGSQLAAKKANAAPTSRLDDDCDNVAANSLLSPAAFAKRRQFQLAHSAAAATTQLEPPPIGTTTSCDTRAPGEPLNLVRPQATVVDDDVDAGVRNYHHHHLTQTLSAGTEIDGSKSSRLVSNASDNNNANSEVGDNKMNQFASGEEQVARESQIDSSSSNNKLTRQQQQMASNNNNNQGSRRPLMKMDSGAAGAQQLPLPSTNRLISEHQARQKQALFRCLAERQKMLDESGQRPMDLMSAGSLRSLASPAIYHQQQQQHQSSAARSTCGSVKSSGSRRRRSASHTESAASAGVPLSAVDLNSISDVQIDELLGRLASASSSSLSSNGESLDSSDLSSASGNSDGEDDSCSQSSSSSELARCAGRLSSSGDDSTTTGGRRHGKRRGAPVSHATDAPNVIGVHEDERTGCGGADVASAPGGRNGRANCRDSHRLARLGNQSTDHDDDDDEDHELLSARPGGSGAATGVPSSLSPLPSAAGQLHPQQQKYPHLREEDEERAGKLEQYFASGHQHEFSSGEPEFGGAGGREEQASVEEVLARMLRSLNEIGPNEPERVTDLIERDFVQLEQLLNYSLAATTNNNNTNLQKSTATANDEQKPIRSQQQAAFAGTGGCNTLAQKLISCQQQPHHLLPGNGGNTTLSKDSDYGSDTQSADCFWQGADSPANKWLARHQAAGDPMTLTSSGDSPSPTSLATNSSSTGSTGASSSGATKQQQPSQLQLQPTLSPLAIELSFKLAESLQRLAQQRRAGGSQPAPPHHSSTNDDVMQQPASDEDEDEDERPSAVRLVGGSGEQQVVDEEADDEEDELDARTSHVGKLDGAMPAPLVAAAPSARTRKSPMKSIVMINANRPPSAASIVSASNSVSAASPFAPSAASSHSSPTPSGETSMQQQQRRNLTPVNGMSIGGCGDRELGQPVAAAATTANGAVDQRAAVAKPLRQPFKTRVNLNASTGADSVQADKQVVAGVLVSNVIVASGCGADDESKKLKVPSGKLPNQHQATATSAKLRQGDKEEDDGEEEAVIEDLKRQVVDLTSANEAPAPAQAPNPAKAASQASQSVASNQNQAQVASNSKPPHPHPQPGDFVRRRSARSSLRRRPSLTGSIGSIGDQLPRQPRPGSPLPRPLLASAVSPGEEAPASSHPMQQQQQPQQPNNHQLQRALILAQKYNYSPAKLAASKLSHKLLIGNNLTSSVSQEPSSGISTINGSQALNHQHREKQEPATGATDETGKRRTAINITGQVQMDIFYLAKSGLLTVHVMQCTQLAPVSKRRTTSNPYVKLYLLPDRSKSGKRKSSIQRGQLDPIFDEKFTFGPLQLADFDRKLLWLSVWHKDRLGRNEFLGELRLPMSQVRGQLLSSDLSQSTAPKWYQLSDRYHTVKNSDIDREDRKKTDTTIESKKERETQRQVAQSAASNKLQQQQAADKLGELQRKAARLTTAMGASTNTTTSFPTRMNCTLGPPIATATTSGSDANSKASLSALITGKLFVALKFVPENQDLGLGMTIGSRGQQNMMGELQVMVKEARNIAGFDFGPALHQSTGPGASGDTTISGNQAPVAAAAIRAPPAGALPNPYCKCYLLASSGQRLAKQKTPTLKRSANPRWDHKCVFSSLKLGQLAGQAVEIHMYNRDQSILVSSSSNEYLGAVRLCLGTVTGSQMTDSLGQSINNDSESIASDQSNGELSDRLSRQNSGASHSGTSQTLSSRRSTLDQQRDEEPEGSLCTERESRLWAQVLRRPGIWVYGELRLRQLRPLVAANASFETQMPSAGNNHKATLQQQKQQHPSAPAATGGSGFTANGSHNAAVNAPVCYR